MSFQINTSKRSLFACRQKDFAQSSMPGDLDSPAAVLIWLTTVKPLTAQAPLMAVAVTGPNHQMYLPRPMLPQQQLRVVQQWLAEKGLVQGEGGVQRAKCNSRSTVFKKSRLAMVLVTNLPAAGWVTAAAAAAAATATATATATAIATATTLLLLT